MNAKSLRELQNTQAYQDLKAMNAKNNAMLDRLYNKLMKTPSGQDAFTADEQRWISQVQDLASVGNTTSQDAELFGYKSTAYKDSVFGRLTTEEYEWFVNTLYSWNSESAYDKAEAIFVANSQQKVRQQLRRETNNGNPKDVLRLALEVAPSGRVGAAAKSAIYVVDPKQNQSDGIVRTTTFSNKFAGDAVVLQTRARELVKDANGRYWLKEPNGKLITPSGKYDFVTMPNGKVIVAKPNTNPDFSTHLGLSGGKDVNYAGSIKFSNSTSSTRGTILEWRNNSGHYQPSSALKNQANLPVEKFKNQ